MATSLPGEKMTTEDWKKRNEFEEARKAETAPAEVDEYGKDINPHIPQCISEAPRDVTLSRPSLKHQRVRPEQIRESAGLSQWHARGVKQSSTATKFCKDACENCGSMTHKKKECVERPRRVGDKHVGEDICPDEHMQPDLQLDFAGKRDRSNGYDADEYQRVIDEYDKVEMAKRQLKVDHLKEESKKTAVKAQDSDEEEAAPTAAADSDSEDDEDKYADEVDMPGTKFDSKHRTTIRNLRIREDAAKYLRNLDLAAAHYDAKTRSVRDNPFKNNPRDDLQ